MIGSEELLECDEEADTDADDADADNVVVNGCGSGVPERGAEPNTGNGPPVGVVVVVEDGVSVERQWEDKRRCPFRGEIRLYLGMGVCVVDGASG